MYVLLGWLQRPVNTHQSICTLPRMPSDNSGKNKKEKKSWWFSAYWHKNTRHTICLSRKRYIGEPIYDPWFCYQERNQWRWKYSTYLGKTIPTSFRIKKLPSAVLPCTDLDKYPKALSVVSRKYTKAKIKFVKGEMPQIHWSCCWCSLHPVNLGDAHSISHKTRSPSLHFFCKKSSWHLPNTYSLSRPPTSPGLGLRF